MFDRPPHCVLPAVLAACAWLVRPASLAQDASAPGPSAPVLQTGTRLVVEDVLVLDARGEAVHGLPRSAFHVFDQGKPQSIRNFEEGSPNKDGAEVPPSLPSGTFSNNSFLYSPSLVSDVFLIDADSLQSVPQLFLVQQLKDSIASLPPGVQASVFCQTYGHTVQMRGLTANRADLYKGVTDCIPRLPTNLVDPFASGMQQLLTVAATLQPVPGRKNILWFSGPFPLMPLVNADQVKGHSANYVTELQAMHQMQALLSEARITLFPLDPRGVEIQGMPDVAVANVQEQNRSPSSAMSREDAVPVPTSRAKSQEYDYMQEMAEATGGTAFHLNNLAEEIDQAIALGRDAYSLSYAPAGYLTDNSWHSVRVTVDGPYRVSYRQGYLASWTGPVSSGSGGSGRLQIDGSTSHVVAIAAGPQGDTPLLFTVRVDPEASTPPEAASPKHHPTPGDHVQVTVQIPVQQLGFTHEGGKWQSSATVAAYAYDDLGRLKGGEQQELDSTLSDEQWPLARRSQVATHQNFVLPRAAKYVLFVVQDKASRRQGTLMLSARVLLPSA